MHQPGFRRAARGVSLVGVLIGLIVLAVAMLALTTSILLMNAASQSTDSERFAAQSRACGELLLALNHEEATAFSPGQDCPGGAATPGNWWDSASSNGAAGQSALDTLCGSELLEVRCETTVNPDGYRVDLRSTGLAQTEVTLLIPVADDEENGDEEENGDDDDGEECGGLQCILCVLLPWLECPECCS